MAVADIIVTPCKIYYGDYGAALPADTVAYAGSWGASWTALGYTSEPLSVELKREMTLADVQESLGAVAAFPKSEEMTIETTLAELNLSELNLAWGGTKSTTPPGTGQPGKDELTIGDDITAGVKSWGFEGRYVAADGLEHPFRMIVYRGVADFGGKLEFGKEKPTGTPLKITVLADMTKSAGARMCKVVKITAAASG